MAPPPRPLRDQAELFAVLARLLDLVRFPHASYRLVGTGAALAQGVTLPTGDIDILVAERSSVDRFAAALAGFPCPDPPAWLPDAGQYFTHFTVDGVKVGASTVEVPGASDTVECVGVAPWRHYVDVPVGGHVVPAVALELRLASELVRGRAERVEALVEHLRVHGADLDLVERSMRDRGVWRQDLLDRIRLAA